MVGVAAVALLLSTLTDSSLGAALGALAVLVLSQVLVVLDAASFRVWLYLPTRYWLSWVDLFRDPILWHDVQRGVLGCRARATRCAARLRLGPLHDQRRHQLTRLLSRARRRRPKAARRHEPIDGEGTYDKSLNHRARSAASRGRPARPHTGSAPAPRSPPRPGAPSSGGVTIWSCSVQMLTQPGPAVWSRLVQGNAAAASPAPAACRPAGQEPGPQAGRERRHVRPMVRRTQKHHPARVRGAAELAARRQPGRRTPSAE